MREFLLLICIVLGVGSVYGQKNTELYDQIAIAFSEGRNQDVVALLEKGIQQNDKVCYGRLASCYLNGIGVPQDINKARYYAEKGSELRNSFSSLILGYTYIIEQGDDLWRGIELAIPYLKDAFLCDDEEGDDEMYANAVGLIAMYECNFKRYDKCKDWLKAGLKSYPKNVTLNDQAALMYLNMEDYANAVKCARVGSAVGSINSEFVLGWCMVYGTGIPKDEISGFKKIRKAALLEYSTDPMVALADCYYNGLGTASDKMKAKEWYEKAASMGDENAEQALRELY